MIWRQVLFALALRFERTGVRNRWRHLKARRSAVVTTACLKRIVIATAFGLPERPGQMHKGCDVN